MRSNRFRLLVASTAVLALLGAACGDDDDTATTDTSGEAEGGATFEFVALDAGGPITKDALEKGDIDIALLFSSDGAIAANDWVALEDDQDLQPVDNFIPAVNSAAVTDEVTAALNAVSDVLTVEAMQEMVAAVSIDGENPADVASDFLADITVPEGATGDLTVGSANFAESEITAELYAQALESSGATVEKKLQFGARDAYLPALISGELDVVPEFVGTLAYYFDANADVTADLEHSLEVSRALAEANGVTLLEPAEADSINTFVVTQETADEYGLETVSDLAEVDEPLVLGGPPECPERPLCLQGLVSVYGLKFQD